MNSKKHFYVSFAKSVVRGLGCILCVLCDQIYILPLALLVAEILGVVEEIVDER